MPLAEIKPREHIHTNSKLFAKFNSFKSLIHELNNRDLTPEVSNVVNNQIQLVNNASDEDLSNALSRAKRRILGVLAKKMNIVAKNHYTGLWLSLGIAIFGLPLGVAMGISLGNMAFMGVGLAMGIPIGLAIGAGLDKKANEEGRQLSI
jgi:hypothetical protein